MQDFKSFDANETRDGTRREKTFGSAESNGNAASALRSRKTDAATIFREGLQNGTRLREGHRSAPAAFPPALVMKVIDSVLLSPFRRWVCRDTRAGTTGWARSQGKTGHAAHD